MKKITTLILLLAILLLLLTAACGDKDKQGSYGGLNTVVTTPVPGELEQTSYSANATATYGADQFYIQHTAIANEGQ